MDFVGSGSRKGQKPGSMPQMKLPKRYYPLRTGGYLLAFIPAGAFFYLQQAGIFYWVFLFMACLLWPHVAYAIGMNSPRPNETELRLLMVDSVIQGATLPMIAFNILPGTMFFMMNALTTMSVGGFQMFLKGLFWFMAGVVIVISFMGIRISPEPGLAVSIACIPGLLIYPLALAFMTRKLSKKLIKARSDIETQKNQLEAAYKKIKQQMDLLDHISKIDGLTSIANRRRFDDYFEKQWQNAIRNDSVLSIIMIDIDHFKAYNDFCGHGKGDECLKLVAKALSDTIKRPNDMVARYGGDEFVCVLPATDIDGAMTLAEEMRRKVFALSISHGEFCPADCVTISLGVSSMRPGKESASALLLQQSDNALYIAKKESRNICRKYCDGDMKQEEGRGDLCL
jgi:diguanylate cyclase (GGDEF)-like protein